MAALGFFKLLKAIKITSLAALSQESSGSSQFQQTILTQITLNTATSVNMYSNEALCLELLNIMRRCLVQHVDIKVKLYDGTSDNIMFSTCEIL